MKINKFLLTFGLIAGLGITSACSSDEPVVNGPTEDDGSKFYASVCLTMSNTSRATEGDETADGYEIGQDTENAISRVHIYLTTRDANGHYTIKAKGVAKDENLDNIGSTPRPTYVAVFQGNEVRSLIESGQTEVYAFVNCNISTSLENSYTLRELSFEKTENMLYGVTNLRMSGAPVKLALPDVATLLRHDTKNNPYLLTPQPIKVERCLARFDFKSNYDNSEKKANYFEIKEGDNVYGAIEITEMALINDQQNTYVWGRASEDGLTNFSDQTHSTFKLVSKYMEAPHNWVASYTWDHQGDKTFFNEFTTATPQNLKNWMKISDLTKDDYDENWNPGTEGYKIWTYVGENTIAKKSGDATDVNTNQTKAVTTGVAFKGKIVNTAIPGFGKGALYRYGMTIYGNFSAFAKAAVEENEDGAKVRPDLASAFNRTWAEDENGTYEATFTTYFRDWIRDANGKVIYYGPNGATTDKPTEGYEPKLGEYQENNVTRKYTLINNAADNSIYTYDLVNGEYPVYYYYWNRHDDNGQSNKMGPMEFAVVRNNVYKLYINAINTWGHPNDPKKDPDPEKPEQPDESEDMYISVQCEVLPWTVRVNNIEF